MLFSKIKQQHRVEKFRGSRFVSKFFFPARSSFIENHLKEPIGCQPTISESSARLTPTNNQNNQPELWLQNNFVRTGGGGV
jgi:hypothetical protein